MKFGCKVDQPSIKDKDFKLIKASLVKLASTSSEHIIPEWTPISSQGGLSSCVSNATCDALEILLGLEGKVVQLSRLFVYWNARVYTKDTNQDTGSFIRNAFDSLKTLGVCSESKWLYDESKVFAQPPYRAYKEANSNKITSYFRISSDGSERVADIERAVRANHPVVFGTPVSSEFTASYGVDKVWSRPEKSIGRHAMIITGVRNGASGKEFLIRNSWGLQWGDNGHCWFDESYITYDQTSDIWVPTRMPDLKV